MKAKREQKLNSKHTPGQLYTEGAFQGLIEIATDGLCVGYALVSGSIREPEARANANRLAHCWNHHEQLVEALEGMLHCARRENELNPGMEVANAIKVLSQCKTTAR